MINLGHCTAVLSSAVLTRLMEREIGEGMSEKDGGYIFETDDGSGGGGSTIITYTVVMDYEEVMLVLPLARPSALQIPLSLPLILLHTTLFSEDLKRVKLK